MKIFVICGSIREFPRLVDNVRNIFPEEQILVSNGKESREAFGAIIQSSTFVIAHAGLGTIKDLYVLQKDCLIIPRYKKYNEAVDDHQLEICSKLNQDIVCYNTDQISLRTPAKIRIPDKYFDHSEFMSNLNKWIGGELK